MDVVLAKTQRRSHLLSLRSYNAWRSMKERCHNHNHQYFKYYGAVGIKVCEEWLSYKGFLKDMGEPESSMQIDRIDSKGGYCKENCRWVTPSQNCANRGSWSKSGFKGVAQRPSGRFVSHIKMEEKMKIIGTFDTAIEAARAFDVEVIKRHGEFAITNEKLGKFDGKDIHD